MSKPERFEDFYQRLREFQVRQIAQRVSPMQPVEQGDAVQVVLMESWLDDELRCEMVHNPEGEIPCAVEATHRLFSCGPALFMCTPAAVGKEERSHWASCAECQRPASACWRIESL